MPQYFTLQPMEGNVSTWLTQIFSSLGKPFQWWIVIAFWEAGVRVRLGKHTAELKPGIHLRIPFLDRVYVQSTRLRLITTTNQTMTTSDGKVLSVSFAVQFAIADIVRLYHDVANPERTLLNHVLGKSAQVIASTDSKTITPAQIQAAVNESLGGEIWGLDQLAVHVTAFAFVRTYRLLMNDYETFTGMDLEREAGPRQ